MPDDDQGRRQWIVEPPLATGEVSLYVAVGDGVSLNAEQEATLAVLIRSLESGDAEVTGYGGKCPEDGFLCAPQSTCGSFKCGKVSCSLACHPLAQGAARGSTGGTSWSLMGTFSPTTAL